MSDTFRQVGDDETGSTASHFTRRLKIGTKMSATYERDGDRAVLLASRPARGDTIETIGTTAIYVTEASIDDTGQGESARLTVLAESATEEDTGELEPLGEPQYTIEFNELRNKIEAHPCCGTIHSSSKKTWEAWEKLTDSDWIAASDIPTFYSTITAWTRAEYQSLKRQGIDEYIMYLPVITRTLHYLGRPDGVGIYSGTIQTPPSGIFDNAADYWWLAGPDNLMRTGSKYERKTSWTGSPGMSLLLYP